MKAEVTAFGQNSLQYTVKIAQGVQVFTLAYVASKQDCEWMAKQFNNALKLHTAPMEELRLKVPLTCSCAACELYS
jgi:hypothetical protein